MLRLFGEGLWITQRLDRIERWFAKHTAPFALTMLGTTASGDAYTFRELAEMHKQAGYGEVTCHPVPMSPHTIVKAHA